MIKQIFFDFDGVLTTETSGSFSLSKNLSNLTGLPIEKIKVAFKKYSKDIYIGKTDFADIWQKFCSDLGCDIDISILDSALVDTKVNEEMFNQAAKLAKDYSLGIITDNSKRRFDLLKAQLELKKMFHPIIVSAEIGAMKDEEVIFKNALAASGMGAKECVFIDNKKENLIIPAKMGFKTIFHDDNSNDISELVKALQEIGVKI